MVLYCLHYHRHAVILTWQMQINDAEIFNLGNVIKQYTELMNEWNI